MPRGETKRGRAGGLGLALAGFVACTQPASEPAKDPPGGGALGQDRQPAAPDVPASQLGNDPRGWTDAWMLAEAARYLDEGERGRRFRREVVEASLTSHDNLYARARLASYALPQGGWDALPQWTPRSIVVDDAQVERLRSGARPRLPARTPPQWDAVTPTTMAGWVALGRRAFFEYPLRPEVFAQHALAVPAVTEAVGLQRTAEGEWPGVVAFEDIDGVAKIGITCALCHVSVEGDDASVLIEGRAHRGLDYGRMRLAFHEASGTELPERLAARMAAWGRGRADITEDDDEDPVAIPDLWGVRTHAYLTQAATLRHVHPAALAVRQETQILHAGRERTRPPRAIAWAMAMYVYSLRPPARDPGLADARGAELFAARCGNCHEDKNGAGAPISARTVGTDPTLAFGLARGTGVYRPSPLVRVAEAAPYLHHGVVPSLEALLSPERLDADYAEGTRGTGAIPGHRWGTNLSPDDRSALIRYLRTL